MSSGGGKTGPQLHEWNKYFCLRVRVVSETDVIFAALWCRCDSLIVDSGKSFTLFAFRSPTFRSQW